LEKKRESSKRKSSNKSRTKKGLYKVKNPEKYMGNLNNVEYKSSWEYKFCVYCDLTPEVLKWGCEIIVIPYIDRFGKSRRYIPDFYMECRNLKHPDLLNKFLVEVKPEKETKEPHIPKNISSKKMKNLEWELNTWYTNKHKWVYAIEWCKSRDIIFRLVTEKQLGNFSI